MNLILLAAQIIVSILLITFILLQKRGTALGSSFGGGGSFYSTRRGMEKYIYWGAIASGILFILLGILNLLI